MDNGLVITTVVTVLLAFSGYLITYLVNLRTNQRQERLNRVNRQLKELYGPLFALTQASDRVWKAFTKDITDKYSSPAGGIFVPGEKPRPEKMKMWVLWMKTVFMPINNELYGLITKNSDLLIEEEMPDCVLELCAHVESYKTVLAKWGDGDFSQYTALRNFPSEIQAYSEASYKTLKVEQMKLLGKKRG